MMRAAAPRWEPGTRYCYSCLNMILLGRMALSWVSLVFKKGLS